MADINLVLKAISNDFIKNKELFIKYYGHLDSFDGQNNSLYHLVMMSDAPLEVKKMAILTLFHFKVDYNVTNIYGDTFIHTAIKYNNDMDFILDTLHNLCDNGFDINRMNYQRYTFLHTSILHTKKFEDIVKLITYVGRYNFNFRTVDKYNYTLVDYVNFSNMMLVKKTKLTKMIKEGINNMSYKDGFNDDDKLISDRDKEELLEELLQDKHKKFNPNKYGIILNDKNYDSEPAVGRGVEIRKLIISLATDKKMPLLVGKSGVGKTAIVDELAYMIQNDLVPEFLANKIIYEVNLSRVVSGSKFRGELEEHMKEIIDYALTHDAILFIDEMHTIRGAGASTDDKNDIANILRGYIDRYGVKVIGATTDSEYEEYLSNDTLKRRFDVIKVIELDKDKLHDIIVDYIDSYLTHKKFKMNSLFLDKLDSIIDILIELTSDSHRTYNDKLNNPDLVLSIIERSFAYMIVDNDHEYDIKHLALGINDCEKVYSTARDEALKKIYHLTQDNSNKMLQESNKKKSLIIDFNEYIKGIKY